MHDVHLDENPNQPKDSSVNGLNWFFQMNRYQVFVIVVATLGWLFDTMDQQLFILARAPAMKALVNVEQLSPADAEAKRKLYGTISTTIFMLGWATGGLIFGKLGDIIGRAKTMLLTILIYSLCTGLSALSVGFYDFAFYRFITGLGVGGEFAVGVALVAEVMPDNIRAYALSFLQACSAIGNMTAAIISIQLGQLETTGVVGTWMIPVVNVPLTAWRIMFLVGAVPALVTILIRSNLKEPDKWQHLTAEERKLKKAGSYLELFTNAKYSKNTVLGMILALAGVIGIWGIGFFTPELIRSALKPYLEAQGVDPLKIEGEMQKYSGYAMLGFNFAGFFGVYSYGILCQYLGRKPSFLILFTCAMGVTFFVFSQLDKYNEIFWMVPLMGFFQLSIFGGYAVYLPELFPTHLRSTGTSFCYNVGRYIAAFGPSILGVLTSVVYKNQGPEWAFRYAAMTMCSVYLLGIIVLPFLPETKGKPLPE